MKQKITAIIIAKNEESVLANCLETLAWVNKVIVIDNGSTDTTAQIAESFGAKVIHFEHSSFARLRNEALKQVETGWLIYIDSDERVTPILAKEILVHIETSGADVLSMKRHNICYGQNFNHGGWENDVVTRVFTKKSLKKWQGKVHETPIYKGKEIKLRTPLIHLTHRNTTQGLNKTIQWTKIEAELLFKANSSKVNFFTLIRKGFMEFFRRAIIKQGYKDGLAGLIESMVQGINKVLVYIQLWELQQTPSLEEQYRRHEIEIMKEWEHEDISQLKSRS